MFLKQGELIVFPCDTVWGILGELTESACRKIIEIKQRSPKLGFVVLIPKLSSLNTVCQPLTPVQLSYIHRFWPNPVTFILPKHPDIPPLITGGRSTIAVRMPLFPPLNQLLSDYPYPILSSSANLSGDTLPETQQDISSKILQNVSHTTASPEPNSNIASTIVDLCQEPPLIVRQGSFSVNLA